MNNSAGTELMQSGIEPIEMIVLEELEDRLSDKHVSAVSGQVLYPGTDLVSFPVEFRNELARYRDLLKRGRICFFKTFRELNEEDHTFYKQLLPVLHKAFQYGLYDTEYWPRFPKVLIRELRLDDTGSPTYDINRRYSRITRRPTDVEFALGIFLDEVDPLIKDLVVSLAEKGYRPVCSCQGHPGVVDKGGVACDVELSKSVIEFLQSRGAHVSRSKYADIDIPHGGRYPSEFLKVTQILGDELPQISDLKHIAGKRPDEFREFYRFNEQILKDFNYS